MKSIAQSALLLAVISTFTPQTASFAPSSVNRGSWGLKSSEPRTTCAAEITKFATSTAIDNSVDMTADRLEGEQQQSQIVRAPLKYVGPYPCLALRFPDLATNSQRERNVTGISLDFVLDTAANVNTIQQQVASELNLKVVGQALPGVGSAGVVAKGGNTFMLGDAQLEGIVYDEGEEPETFMSQLTASALPVASPASAGLLSLAFLQVFEGGVEFRWGTSDISKPPSVSFISDKSMDEKSGILKNKTKVAIERVPVTQLPTVMITVNGVEMPALLDTGSPITVLNAQAAKQAGIETKIPSRLKENNNPLKAFANRFQEAQATSRGDVLMIMGTDGRRVNLVKSNEPATVEMQGADKGKVDFGSVPLFVGELPGLAALNGLGVESPPAVVVGMDVIRQRPSMLLRAQDNEVWFG